MEGLDYSVQLETNRNQRLRKVEFFIVRLDIAYPVASIIGEYRCGKAEMEELGTNTIQQIFSDILRYFKANRGMPPMHLLVIRDGISIEQYKYIVDTEV
uniref:Piwi domain-containing protein n=1 Tax=Onchocerca volvulus TaxID=6282 RepID=A0A8R1TK25_ONCVO